MAAVSRALFIQFAREPVPGRVKTRMLAALDPVQACELHRELVLWTAGRLVGSGLAPVELCVTGDPGSPLFQECRALGVRAVLPQRGVDLGERMYRALEEGLRRADKVVLVGSDCPAIDARYLQGALDALDGGPVVLGPASDGGYVLIGVTALKRRWFEDVSWGGGEVYARTRERLEETGAHWQALEPLQDIDRPEDLPHWRDISARGSG